MPRTLIYLLKKNSKSVRYEVRKDWGYDKQAKKSGRMGAFDEGV